MTQAINPSAILHMFLFGHNFFGSSCLNIDIFDSKNQRHIPREWFIAPFPIIEKTIELIINGEILSLGLQISQVLQPTCLVH